MDLPYFQVETELLEVSAPELAVLADCSPAEAYFALCHLIRWALKRVPPGGLPSEHDVVAGERAARIIAVGVHWRGDPEAFVRGCCELTHPVLERVEGGIRVRGLKRYDDAVRSPQARAEKASKASRARWQKSSADAQPMLGGCSEDAQGTAQPMLGDAKMEIETEREKKRKKNPPSPQGAPAAAPPAPDDVGDVVPPPRAERARRVFEHWAQVFGHGGRAKFDAKRRRAVEARLRDGYTLEQLLRAVDGCAASPWHRGQNDRGKPYTDLELICRDAKHVDEFLGLAEQTARAGGAPRPMCVAGPCPRPSDGEVWGQPLCFGHQAALRDTFPGAELDEHTVARWVDEQDEDPKAGAA